MQILNRLNEKQNANDKYIKFSIPDGIIDYLMLRIDSTNDALIVKKETGQPLSLLKFDFGSNSLSEINQKTYQIKDLQAGDSTVFNQNEIFVVNKNIKYLWDGKNFANIKFNEHINAYSPLPHDCIVWYVKQETIAIA